MVNAVQSMFGYEKTDPQIFLVSTLSEGKINGQIATDVMGFTFIKKWPRVIVFLGKDKYTSELISKSNIFAVNLLSIKQLGLVRTFGVFSGRKIDKFNKVTWRKAVTGSPIVEGSVGFADCQVIEKIDLGDHTAYVGLIKESGLLAQDKALRISYFKKHAPIKLLGELLIRTKISRKAVERLFEEYLKKKALLK